VDRKKTVFSPVGTFDISPAFQCWVDRQATQFKVPQGTTEIYFAPFLHHHWLFSFLEIVPPLLLQCSRRIPQKKTQTTNMNRAMNLSNVEKSRFVDQITPRKTKTTDARYPKTWKNRDSDPKKLLDYCT